MSTSVLLSGGGGDRAKGGGDAVLQVDAEAGADLQLALRLKDALGGHFSLDAGADQGKERKVSETHPLNRLHLSLCGFWNGAAGQEVETVPPPTLME